MNTKLYTIVGKPVEHSVSPLMFKAAYACRTEFSYERNETQSAEESIALFKSKFCGGNVTAPYKEGILALADEASDEAIAIGAVNAVTVNNGKVFGFNTDHIGVSESLREFGVNLRGANCVLLGAGGAAKAAAFALSAAGANLIVINRSKEAGEILAAQNSGIYIPASDQKKMEEQITQSHVIVNTLYPQIDLIDEGLLSSNHVVFDASYVGSALLSKAKKRNCVCIDGRYWVYHQALPCFVKFTGLQPDKQAMRKVIDI